MRRITLLGVAVIVLLAFPAAASAATVTKTASTISYIADDQERNDVTISLAGDVYTLTEEGNAPGPGGIAVKNGGGCQLATQGTTTTATCPAGGTTLLDVDAGDQNDTVRVVAPTPARILGGDGSDVLRGGSGADTLAGGPGIDVADYSDRGNPLTITLDGQPGDGEAGENDNDAADIEIVNGGSGADTITGSDADNVLNGNGGNDTLNGQGGSDALNRGDRDGNLDAGAGADVLNGGAGIDAVSYASAALPVRVTLNGVVGDGAVGENDNVGADVENVTGGKAGDVLIGNSGANVLQGGPGDDRLLGGRGPDTLDGGNGNDALQARDGAVDQLLCGNGTDGVIADTRDVLNVCESVQRAVVQALTGKAKMRRGVIRIPVRCSAYATEGCTGTVTLKYRKTTLGKKAFKLRSGAKSTLKVKLSRNAQKLVKKKRKLTTTATLSTKDASGSVTRTTKKIRLTR
jgi:Ca2+-binding RTX toxin-like protein